jgi:predicted outer membrane repeat protein
MVKQLTRRIFAGVIVYRTDQEGTIVFAADGKQVNGGAVHTATVTVRNRI